MSWDMQKIPSTSLVRNPAGNLLIPLLTIALVACSAVQPVSVDEQQEALALVDKGTLLLRERVLDEAEAAFDVAWQLAKLPAALDGLGCVAFGRENYTAAEQIFAKVYELDPSYTNALVNLAQVYERTGRVALAEGLYQRGLVADPRHFRARNNLAVLIVEHGGDGDRTTRKAREELLRARAVIDHPILEENLRQLE